MGEESDAGLGINYLRQGYLCVVIHGREYQHIRTQYPARQRDPSQSCHRPVETTSGQV